MSKYNFVTINRRIYLFETLDVINRVFVGYKITKPIVDDLMDGKLTDLEYPSNKTTILFHIKGENDVYIRETTISDFKRLYSYIPSGPHPGYTEKEYLEAKNRILKGKYFFLKEIFSADISFERAKMRVESYERFLTHETKYRAMIDEQNRWLDKVKEWFS